MFFIELFIGEFGASNVELISYLIMLISTVISYIYGIVVGWSIKSIFIMAEVSILGIISNISEIPLFYILSLMLILILLTTKTKFKFNIKNKVAPNIASIFLIFFVLITGSFIILDTAKDGVNQTINKITTK